MLAAMSSWAIPSQALQECNEGVTTRSWSPERTVKAHERATRKGRYSLSYKVTYRGKDKEPCDNKLELADNVTNNNALLRRLKERGNVKTFSGGNIILQEIMYNDTASNNTNSYSGLTSSPSVYLH
jgi:hypothetical protein